MVRIAAAGLLTYVAFYGLLRVTGVFTVEPRWQKIGPLPFRTKVLPSKGVLACSFAPPIVVEHWIRDRLEPPLRYGGSNGFSAELPF